MEAIGFKKDKLYWAITRSDFLGTDVDINEDGSIIAVGSLMGNANGYARVLKFIGNSWVPQGSDVLGETLNDQFGRSVSLSANGSIVSRRNTL